MLDTSIKGKKVMKEKTLCFSQHKNITPSGQDGAVIRFPFTMVDSGLIGSPEESKKTTSHRLEVTIARSVYDPWRFDGVDLELILFEIGRREIIERLRQKGRISELESVSVPQEKECPFDPKRIDQPDGFVVNVEIPSKIGF